MKKVKAIYLNLRIKYKMFLLISLILLLFSIGGLFILQYAFHVYNDEIHRQSAQSLKVSSTSIENELEKMERLSYQVATDQYIQSYLFNMKNSESEYQSFFIGTELRRRLLEIGALNKYVDSLQMYDVEDRDYAAGNRIVTIEEERLQEIKDRTNLKQGGIEWFFPSETDDSFIAAREVRSYLNLTFERLGMIAVRFNMDAIISSFSSKLAGKEAKLLVFNANNEIIYPQDASKADQYMVGHIGGRDGYSLLEYEGDSYFATYTPASYSNWTYMIISPYGNLFQAVSSVRKAVLITYVLLFLLLVFLGMQFIGGITGPIESLNRKMKRVQTGEISHYYEQNDVQLSRDEAGNMHDNFNKMMKQINFLIEENYKKQLVIKDSEYKTLQAQINPHFLYNTLESINWAAKMGSNKETSRMAVSLGFILRSSLDTNHSLISLEEELKIIRHYITIQSCRFEERLAFREKIPANLLNCQVPRFSLQPLVENAIRYGLQQMVGTCTIVLEARTEKDKIIISVKDDGPGMDKPYLERLASGKYQSKGTGIGLKNIDERLKILFGDVYGVHVASEKNKGTTVEVTIPSRGGNEHVQSAAGR
ncbi:sensor histidine kinase [Sediminibacillus albus]|uniref:histidine kinase n=1 Tax=Sediminibacillus albus TaxID=407036 RepID=A0A1G8YDZ3_9BACI|nr:sensor histidine kinase [Sediminibacillus albus]SDK01068.1 two-component system, sensor histidine kinase YesM [Sediminibacillus albus]